MAKILMVGIDPELVDFSDPALPPGITADMIRQGIARGREDLRSAGHDVEQFYVSPDPNDLGNLTNALAEEDLDCLLIGGGVRMPPRNLVLFERILNIAAASASHPKIALVGRPEDAAEAVARALR